MSYRVFWRSAEQADICEGWLELSLTGVGLTGTDPRGRRLELEIPFGSGTEIRLAREPELALNQQPVLLIEGGAGEPSAFVTSAAGAKETFEIAARALSLRWRRWTPE
jgi:hypothetical protein